MPPVSCLTSLLSVMVKSRAGRGYDESRSECRAQTLCALSFVCGFLCTDFCAPIFGADLNSFLVRFFGADFLSRAARRGGFKQGGFPIWTCPSFFVLFGTLDFPDLLGGWSGDFPDLSFSAFSAY